MGGVAENVAGTELLHPWGSESDYREAAAERVGWEMALSFTGGSHKGSGFHRRQDVHNQKAEHGREIHCNAIASGTLRGDDAERGGEGHYEMVGPEENRLGESESAGSGDIIGGRIGGRQGRGGKAGRRQQGKRLEWGGMEWSECRRVEQVQTSGASADEWSKCRRVGSKIVNILHRDRF